MTGGPGLGVDITLTALPNVLTAVGGVGADIPITNYVTGWAAIDDPNSATTFDPLVGSTGAALDGTNGQLFVWIGADLVVASDQAPDNYTAQIQVTVAYNGS